MSDKLKGFNLQLKTFLDESSPDTAEVFNLGVEVGRELQLNNITNYTMSAIIDREEGNKKWLELVALNKRIETALKKLIIFCFDSNAKEQIYGRFEVRRHGNGYGYGDCDKWSDEIAERFGVSYSHADMETYGGEFEMVFNAVSWLSEINKKYNLPTTFRATLSNNSGEEHEYVGNKEDAESKIWNVSTMNLEAFTKMTSEKIEQYISELEKQVVFFVLKYD